MSANGAHLLRRDKGFMGHKDQIFDQSFSQRVPQGDDRIRRVCDRCEFIAYDNPKIVVGSVATWQGRVLLCKRAIEPRQGFWTLPAGFMENEETVEEGAKREAWEEARISITIDRPLAIYSVPRISQVQIIFRAAMVTGSFAAGPESEVVSLFDWGQIPWTKLAFPSVEWALKQWYETRKLNDFPLFSNPLAPKPVK